MKNMKITHVVMIILIITSVSFTGIDSFLKRKILFKAILDVKGWFDGSGKIYVDFNKNQEIEKIFVEGFVFPVGKKGFLDISRLKKDTLNTLFVSDSVDDIVLIQLQEDFSRYGGKINVIINMIDRQEEELIYIHRHNDSYKAYSDSIHPLREIIGLDIKLKNSKVETYHLKLNKK
ncbi:MAG: hypothetical protein LR005_00320 [Candidatus Pacebacteria bacterium]|nr:hypothetical protein [Candidatus Paceibacterota bacterium]